MKSISYSKSAIFIIAVLAIFSFTANAEVIVLPSLKVTHDVPKWIESSSPISDIVECRPTEEISGTHLCQFRTTGAMMMALGRANFFIEGYNGLKKLYRKGDPELNTQYGGFDLRGVDLVKFYEDALEACAKDGTDDCFLSQEKELFETLILPETKKNPNFIIITFANQGRVPWRDVVSHEIMHAQYFSDSKYREIVDKFWVDEVPNEEKASVKEILYKFYDTSDEGLMKNEFQAFMLMAGAESSFLRHLVPKYRSSLISKLAAAGIHPVQVQ